MEAIRLDISRPRTIREANIVHRTPTNWPEIGIFRPVTHFLYYHQEGRRCMEDREEQFDLEPGDLVLFFAGCEYVSHRPPGPYRAMNILFAPLPSDMLAPGSRPPAATPDTVVLRGRLRTGQDPWIRERFAEVVHLVHAREPLRRRRASTVLEELLLECALRAEARPERWSAPVEYVAGFIERHLDRRLALDELADLVALSRRSLTRRFREAMGCSVQAFQMEKRLALAASILKTHPDMALREIAATLGFYDEFHLSRAFRQRWGQSPAAFRSQAASGAATVFRP